MATRYAHSWTGSASKHWVGVRTEKAERADLRVTRRLADLKDAVQHNGAGCLDRRRQMERVIHRHRCSLRLEG